MKFLEFFKEKEKKLIEGVGEKNWREDKVYFVDEIVDIVKEWEEYKITECELPEKPANVIDDLQNTIHNYGIGTFRTGMGLMFIGEFLEKLKKYFK